MLYSTAGGTMFGSVLMVLATLGSASLQEPDLRSWLEVHAELEGKRLQAAVELCETEDIGTVDELREVHDSGRFGALGFKPVSAGRIEQALAAVAPYERRRAQDGASATSQPRYRPPRGAPRRGNRHPVRQHVSGASNAQPPHAPKPPTSILLYGVWLPPLERPFSLSRSHSGSA